MKREKMNVHVKMRMGRFERKRKCLRWEGREGSREKEIGRVDRGRKGALKIKIILRNRNIFRKILVLIIFQEEVRRLL